VIRLVVRFECGHSASLERSIKSFRALSCFTVVFVLVLETCGSCERV
jgi:hypothetical protein